MNTITVIVGEDPNDIKWSRKNLPRHWDEAHGSPPVAPGTYYYDCTDEDEENNAWAWEGPFIKGDKWIDYCFLLDKGQGFAG